MDVQGKEDPALAALLRAVGVDVAGEAAALKRAAAGLSVGGAEGAGLGLDGGDVADLEMLLVAAVGDGQELEDDDGSWSGRAEGDDFRSISAAAAAVWGDGDDGPGASPSPTTSVEGDAEADEGVVEEVFEGTAAATEKAEAAEGSPRRRRQREAGGDGGGEQEQEQQGALLLGELGRVLEGRARRRQQRGEGLVMKVRADYDSEIEGGICRPKSNHPRTPNR